MSWIKNGFFLLLLCLGLAWIGSSLLSRDRVEKPSFYRTLRLTGMSEVRNEEGTVQRRLVARADEEIVIAKINAALRDAQKNAGLQAAPEADSLTLARRISLALTGTIPALEEVRALEKQPQETRAAWWLSHVLEDRRFAEYTAERLTRAYVGTENGPFIFFRRDKLTRWLADEIAENRPYDRIVQQLLSDEGTWTDRPAVNFISIDLDDGEDFIPDRVKLAARTSRAFLATRIDCLQCHDDNLDEMNFGTAEKPVDGKQSHFHELAAFFEQAARTRRGISDDPKKKYEAQYLHETSPHPITAHVPFGEEYFSGHGRPREQLARWVTHRENKPFSRAIVNRIWALLLGRPLVEPIDAIPHFGELPTVLELLAGDFAANNFDLQRLIRLIASTSAFRAASEADFEVTSDHEKTWAVFPLTRLRPEQMAGALIQSSQVSTIDGDAHILWKIIKFGQTNEFVKRYGDTGQDEFSARSGTIPQRLLLMNGELVDERVKENPVLNLSTRIAGVSPNHNAAIEAAYLAVLTRRPTEEEREHFRAKLDRERRTPQTMSDLYWTLVNSTEFSWNH